MADEPARSWIPVPDPTLLTTEQLRREIERLRTELMERIDAAKTLVEAQVASNRNLYEERFRGVAQTFAERQHQFDASFAASKEAIAKSDQTTDKRLENSDEKIADLKDRLIRIEGKGEGANWLLGVGIAVAGLVIAGALFVSRAQPVVPTPVTQYIPQPQPQLVQPVQPVQPKP